MKPSIRYLEIGSSSCLDVRLPVLELGSGKPVLSILCTMHGDEALGLLAAHRFLEKVDPATLRGQLRIIPVANPLAHIKGARLGADLLDLNRMGRGNPAGKITERLGAALFGLLSDSSLVIDLHEFEIETRLLGIYIKAGDERTNHLVLGGLGSFAPRLVWSLDLSRKAEALYGTSLIAALIQVGVPCFAIEGSLSRHETNTEHMVEGLCRVARWMGLTADGDGKSGPPTPHSPIAYHRHEVHAEQAGIWQPEIHLMEHVRAGCQVGGLISMDLQGQQSYEASKDGAVIQLRAPDLVHTGTSLYALGTVDQETSRLLSEARSFF